MWSNKATIRSQGHACIQDSYTFNCTFLFSFQVLLRIFSFLSHREILKYAVVCKKWHLISQDSRLWGFVSLRPEISGLRVEREDHMLQLISTKFGNNLRYLELNADMVTPNVLVDLAKKCANLTHLLLDFAQASQLHDFTDLGAFPTKLKFLTLYLSDTIFLDNFMKRIYRYKFPNLNYYAWFKLVFGLGDQKQNLNKTQKIRTFVIFFSFINGLEMVHIVGTYEKAEMEEGEIYEVVNIKTLKQATPNLRIINLWGINFIDDTHVEAFSSNCIQLQVISTHWQFSSTLIYILVIPGFMCQLLFQSHWFFPQNLTTKVQKSKMSNVETNIITK